MIECELWEPVGGQATDGVQSRMHDLRCLLDCARRLVRRKLGTTCHALLVFGDSFVKACGIAELDSNRSGDPHGLEAEVRGYLMGWVIDPLIRLAQQLPYGNQALYRLIPPNEVLHGAIIHLGTFEVEVEAPVVPISSEFYESSRQAVFTLAAEPPQPDQVMAGCRYICVGQVRSPGELLSSLDDMPDLVAAYQQQDVTSTSRQWQPSVRCSRTCRPAAAPSDSNSGSGSSMSRQQSPTTTLVLLREMQQGSGGAVVLGEYGGVPAFVKLLGPDGHGLSAYATEAAIYSMLEPVQGTLVPRLLGAGSLPGGVVFLATSKVAVTPLSSLDNVVDAPVVAAALQALATLHRDFPGFLHNDIRLENILLLDDTEGGQGSPKSMLLDFGWSHTGVTEEEQRREYRELKRLLRARA